MLAPGVPLPASLRGLARLPWRWIAPGISRIAISFPGPASRELIYLLRAAPGKNLPAHRHLGWETTCVLAGGFTDSTGDYGPGDFVKIENNVSHKPVSGPGEACICLIASEGRLRMRGLLARLVQPLVGV
jgi:putative transcriptional regulator